MTKPLPYFFGKVSQGTFHLNNRELYREWTRGLPDGDYQMTLEPKFKPRTTGKDGEDTNWNGYYWGVIIEILHEEMGLTREACHEELKIKFNPKGYVVQYKNGEKENRTYGGSTQKMSDKRFKQYCYDIRRWAQDPDDGLNCYIPEPHETPESFRATIEAYERMSRR